MITVSNFQYPISILDPLKTCKLGEKLYPKILSFFQSKISSSVFLTGAETTEENANLDLKDLEAALKKIRDKFGPSYHNGSNGSFILNFTASVGKRYNVKTKSLLQDYINLNLKLNPKWPSIDVALPSDTICPLDGRRQCAYCKWWYNKKNEDCCSKCHLFQLDDYASETDVPADGYEHLPDDEWVQVGRTISSNVVLEFPDFIDSFKDNDYDGSIRIEEYHVGGKDVFMKAQVTRWCSRQLGRHPSLSELRYYLKYALDNESLIKFGNLSPFEVIVDLLGVGDLDVIEGTVKLAIELKMYLPVEEFSQKPRRLSIFPYWNNAHKLLAAFLMDKDDVQDIGEPSIKALCTENDFMVASAEGCGYFTDKDNSLVEMFKTLLRESQRLKVEIVGFNFDESLDHLGPQYLEDSNRLVCLKSLIIMI